MHSNEIRKKFIQYFEKEKHKSVKSAPVIPHDDPTLLFINAGMNQFKDIFLGERKAPYKRAVSSQKCVRAGGKHNDLDNVGHTSRHLTFFEMLGNFSFGDYFKEEAIRFSWEVSTEIFQLDEKKIWASVFETDDEAFELWKKYLPEKRIVRFGESENFWAMGDVGPCGPCSELLYDKGSSYSSADTPLKDASGERFFEFWNLVFMEKERRKNGKESSLPSKNIDTGLGLERLMSLIAGVDNVFLTDILRSLIAQVEKLTGKKYDEKDQKLSPAYHVIADHIRTLSFAIADGAIPSNTDRGYVLRKILRRSVRYGRMLGLDKPFLAKIVPTLTHLMGEDYPEIKTSEARIQEILTLEEESFYKTLKRGGNLLADVMKNAKRDHVISGDDAFKLKDTYGFPLEEIMLIAKDDNVSVDLNRFEELEKKAKELSKKAHKKTEQTFSDTLFKDLEPSTFTGYDHTSMSTPITYLVKEGEFVETLKEGDHGIIVLEETPFYAEKGGQVGDIGRIETENSLFEVEDTQSPFTGVIIHVGKMMKGSFKKDERVLAEINTTYRENVERNHTATHLLHWALEKVLGSHVRQAGSLVEDERLRFDFNHHKGITLSELQEVERLINEKVCENHPVLAYELSFEEAQKKKEIKQFFGEKYGDTVRVIDAAFCKELCGGTHTSRTGNIGLFKITKETSIAKGIRRIFATTGLDALNFVHAGDQILYDLSEKFKSPREKITAKIDDLFNENAYLQQELKKLRKDQLQSLQDYLIRSASQSGDMTLITKVIDVTPKELGPFADSLAKSVKSGVIALGIKDENRCQIAIRVTDDLDIDARELIKKIAPLIKGGGGGKKTSAQAGGTDPTNLASALEKIAEL